MKRSIIILAAALFAVTAQAQRATREAREAAREAAEASEAIRSEAYTVAETVHYLNFELPPEEHAVLILPEGTSLHVGGSSVPIALIPPGDRSIAIFGQDITVSGGNSHTARSGNVSVSMSSSSSTPVGVSATANGTFEAGKYYTVEHETNLLGLIKSATIVELTDERRLEQARQEAADMREQTKAYLAYMKANPRELNGIYVSPSGRMQLSFDGERFHVTLGKRHYSGRYWFDDKSFVLLTDTEWREGDEANVLDGIRFEPVVYKMEGDRMVILPPTASGIHVGSFFVGITSLSRNN